MERHETWEIQDREVAKILGHTTYWSGKPCRNGHYAKRYTKSNMCTECQKQRVKHTRDENRAYHKEIKVRIHPEDAGFIKYMVHLLNVARQTMPVAIPRPDIPTIKTKHDIIEETRLDNLQPLPEYPPHFLEDREYIDLDDVIKVGDVIFFADGLGISYIEDNYPYLGQTWNDIIHVLRKEQFRPFRWLPEPEPPIN